VTRLINAVVIDDVITQSKTDGKIYLGGKEITEQEKRTLVAEAKALEGLRLWSIINETIKKEAMDRGWNKSTSLEDLNTGKTIYYVLDLQRSIVEIIKKKDIVK
jgi:hypothetical protein